MLFQKVYILRKKSWHIQEDVFFVCFFKYQSLCFFNPHKYNIHLLPLYPELTKYRHRYLQTKGEE